MGSTKHLSRRGFLGAAGGAAAVGTLGPLSGTALAGGKHDHHGGHGHHHGKGGDIPLEKIGIQLFTVRDLLADNELDLTGTFEMLSDAGYAEVEVGGTYDGRTPAEFRALANSYGLKPEGMHPPGSGGRFPDPAGRQAIWEESNELGLRYVGAPSPPSGFPRTPDGFRAMAEAFNEWGAEARARGLKFYFHNHPQDFALDPDGRPIYDILLEETDPRLVYFEMDIAWVDAGGQSPYEYLRRYGPWRFPLFHVKDLRYAEDGPRTTPSDVAQPSRTYWLTDVGKGDIDFAKIFSALKDPDDHHYFVEHDDAPQDETADSSAPRPRNPAGSANTAWTSRKYLAELEIPRRRHRH